VISKDLLVQNNLAAGRPQDLADAAILSDRQQPRDKAGDPEARD
jgi:hypothetical protein